jgi:hypothetical protein
MADQPTYLQAATLETLVMMTEWRTCRLKKDGTLGKDGDLDPVFNRDHDVQPEILRRFAALEAERDGLRDYAKDANSGFRYIEHSYGQLYGVGWDRLFSKFNALTTEAPGHDE